MGFFDFLTGTPQQSQDGENDGIIQGNESTFPVVRITKVSPRVNGDTLQIYCYIQNDWSHPVELDESHIFGIERKLGAVLNPGEVQELLVYDGPVLKKEHQEVELQYKTHAEGDYFKAKFMPSFNFNAQTETYEVSDFRPSEPVRDIYG